MTKQILCFALSLAVLAPCISVVAQTPNLTVSKTEPARIADVDTIEHTMAAVYDVISGPAGPRDWNRFRSLFYPGARLIPIVESKDSAIAAKMISADEYVEQAGGYFAKEGFFETAVANRIETWGQMAHVWSTYESRHAKTAPPFQRGINSFQLFNDGHRWWVLNISWQDETPSRPIAKKYLSSK
jgi:hypothetical protein